MAKAPKEPSGPKLPDHQKAPELTVEDVQLLADFIIGSLNHLEELYPFLATREYPLYRQCRYAIETEGVNPMDKTGMVLGSLYASLVIHLKEISKQRAGITGIHMPKNDGVKLEDYFPETFPDMVDRFRKVTQKEIDEECVNAAADMIIMGELEGGIENIVPHVRYDVIEQIVEVLMEHEDPDDADESVIENTELKELSEALAWTDEKIQLEADWQDRLDETSRTKAVTRKKLARAINAARDGIDSKCGDGVTKLEHSMKKGEEDTEALTEILWKRILNVAGKRAKDITIRPPRERRAELTERICLQLRDSVRRGLRVVEKDQA